MRTFGSILMIVGANLVVGATAVAFYLADLACSLGAHECTGGLMSAFRELMFSRDGIVFWLLIAVGIVTFRSGQRMRADPAKVINKNSE